MVAPHGPGADDERLGPGVAAEPERCDDGLDNDLDGLADEGCACTVGAMQSCTLGPAAGRGVGVCRDGTQTCEANVEFPAWGACVGSVVPTAEDCGNGLDDDCDGEVDDGCGAGADCTVTEPGQETSCDDGLDGDCDGRVDAQDDDCAEPESCGPLPLPEGEICDGHDNDGDGQIDEGRACGVNTDGDGPCTVGAIRICDSFNDMHQYCLDTARWSPCLYDWACMGDDLDDECSSNTDCPRGQVCWLGCSQWSFRGPPCATDADCPANAEPGTGLGPHCNLEHGVCITDCLHHDDCPMPLICHAGACLPDDTLGPNSFPCYSCKGESCLFAADCWQ